MNEERHRLIDNLLKDFIEEERVKLDAGLCQLRRMVASKNNFHSSPHLGAAAEQYWAFVRNVIAKRVSLEREVAGGPSGSFDVELLSFAEERIAFASEKIREYANRVHKPYLAANYVDKSATDVLEWARRQTQIVADSAKLSVLSVEVPRNVAPSQSLQIFIDDIDSFAKVKEVDPKDVLPLLKKGRLDVGEDEVQRCLEEVLAVPLHKSDWAGEDNDLWSGNLVLRGQRVQTAFALKGRGLRKRALEIAHCGQNGDQIVRLFQSPADLFILQFVGPISENVAKDMAGKARIKAITGKPAQYCIIDGQDTARILRAYGRI